MKSIIFSLILFLPLFVFTQNVCNSYVSKSNVIKIANFNNASVSKTETTYISILSNSVSKSVTLSDAKLLSEQTWRKRYRLYKIDGDKFWTKDASNQIVLFKVNENSASPTVTMSTYSGESVIKRVVYYIQ
jgi:hypothetical protein